MAIKRCPYCRAIIDEKDKYCNNCGTQLLFPEDEFIEEDIPGEKITDDDFKGKKLPKEKKELSGPGGEKGTQNEQELQFEKETKKEEEAETEEEEEEEEMEEEEIEEEEAENEEEGEEEEQIDMEASEENEGEKLKKEEELEEPVTSEEEALKMKTPEAEEEKGKDLKQMQDLTFKTKDLEKIIHTAEVGKEEVERFLAAFKEEERAKSGASEIEVGTPSSVIEEKTSETGEGLPLWADRIKEKPFSGILDTWVEEKKEETESREAAKPTSPSPIGIPEAPDQKNFQFDQEAEEEAAPPSRFVLKLKAKTFDLLFIAGIWLISLWLAANSMDVSLFKLISVSARPVLIYYLILLVSYLSLFLYFLGETLGDRLFAQEE